MAITSFSHPLLITLLPLRLLPRFPPPHWPGLHFCLCFSKFGSVIFSPAPRGARKGTTLPLGVPLLKEIALSEGAPR